MKHQLLYYLRASRVTCFRDEIDKLAVAGIHSLSLAPFFAEFNLVNGPDLGDWRDVLQENSISTPGAHGLFAGQYDLNIAAESREKLEAHQRMLANATMFGVKTYVVHPGPIRDGLSESEQWNVVRRSLDALLPHAEKAGIIMALENLPPGYLGTDPAPLIELVEEYSTPHLRLCIDTGHAHIIGRDLEIFDAMAPYLCTAHLNDNLGDADSHLTPGDGAIDWTALIRKINACPNFLHIEMESFNHEQSPYGDLYNRYTKLLEV